MTEVHNSVHTGFYGSVLNFKIFYKKKKKKKKRNALSCFPAVVSILISITDSYHTDIIKIFLILSRIQSNKDRKGSSRLRF